MRGIIKHIETTKNFWEVNPEFKALPPFKEHREKCRTPGKRKAGDEMWLIVLVHYNRSPLKNIPIKERKENASDLLFKDTEYYNKVAERLSHIIEQFQKLLHSPAERMLISLENKLDERAEMLEGEQYTLENADQMDKLLAATGKLYDEYNRIVDEIKKQDAEDEGGVAKGGGKLSLSDEVDDF
jgi:hypothetical protein